ncbi:hypothetical protein [Solidesulfovibrio sp.]|uniref:hypothetical protein n=1 Tax=Solidesulfovibrio sp. TaxID=2910990 RepID=UPI00262D07E0|nr:hypothetical protein [Solidesulfovibrio sp.]
MSCGKRPLVLVLILALLSASCTPARRTTQNFEPQEEQAAPPQQEPQNAAERKIFTQAIVAGALIGGGVGAGAGALLSRDNPGLGAGIGGLVGTFIGVATAAAIAKKQIETYRNIKLQNKQLEKLLETAQEYNGKVEQQNAAFAQELEGLEKHKKTERQTIAKTKLQELKTQEEQLQLAIAERRKLAETLIPEQKEAYQQTLAGLENEEKRLDGMIKQAQAISETGYVGPLS